MSGGAAGCRAGGRNQGGSCSAGGPGAAGAADAASAAAARPPRDATLKAWTPPAGGPAGGEPRKMAELPQGCCRSGSSRGTSVARPRRWGFALA